MRLDDLGSLLGAAMEGAHPEAAVASLAQRYSYVVPDNRSLGILAGVAPLVEIGAGTGYWASRLRALGVDVIAIDQAPPGGARVNRYHATAQTWTDVIAGDQTLLTEFADRSLFLCWPPLFSSLGDCLSYYGGDIVALIGDGGHRTTRLHELNETFSRVATVPVRALEPFPGATPALTVWRRLGTA
ncbi:MAG: class I SAM-dependent methyltransferase [Candidatus Dormiibacterota bacterium]